MKSNYLKTSFLGLAIVSMALAASAAFAQAPFRSASNAIPDAPQPGAAVESSSVAALDDAQQTPPSSTSPTQPTIPPLPTSRAPQTKRILGIIPNFRAVSTDEKLPPQSAKEKFMDATQDSFDYSSIFIPGMLAAYSLGTNADPEFGHGAVGYGRYFWHAAVDQTSENYMVEFIMPVATREDTRYYTLGHGGFIKRAGYAISRVVVTRTDAGNRSFNFSEVIGAGASSGISSLYYPSRERSFGNTASQWSLDMGIDGASFLVKEFWPDVNRKLFHGSGTMSGTQR